MKRSIMIIALLALSFIGCSGRINSDSSMEFKFDADGATKFMTNFGALYAAAKIEQQIATTQQAKDLANYKIEGYNNLLTTYINGSLDKILSTLKTFQALVNTAQPPSTQPALRATNPQPSISTSNP